MPAVDPIEQSFQAYLTALAALQKAFLRELYRIIAAGYRAGEKEDSIDALANPVVSLVRQYRKQAHGHTADFLTNQASLNGAGVPYIAPDAVGYSEAAARTVLTAKMRPTPLDTWVAAAGPFARAVNNVTRETVILSSEATVQQHPKAFRDLQIENIDTLAQDLGEEDFSASDAWDDLVLHADEEEAKKKLQDLQEDSREGIYQKVLTADTDTAGRPRKPFAWARVLVGAQNCHFCIMLAARGPAYASKDSALFRNVGKGKKDAKSPISRIRYHIDQARQQQRFHDFCDCEVVPVFDRQNWPGKTQYEAARTIYEAAKAEAERHNDQQAALAKAKSQLTGRRVKPRNLTDTTAVLKGYVNDMRQKGWSLDFPPLKPKDEHDDGWELKGWQWPLPTESQPLPRSTVHHHTLTEREKTHIWEGERDRKRGGHAPGSGRANKTEFPQHWTKNRAVQAAQRTIDSPDMVYQRESELIHAKVVDDVLLHAKFVDRGNGPEFFGAFPVRGAGVYANLRDTGIALRAPFVEPGNYAPRKADWHEII